jgi:hypothetical protein
VRSRSMPRASSIVISWSLVFFSSNSMPAKLHDEATHAQ